MGWMFVPLTQYHGGGAAATIEPLAEHIDHYRRMLTSNLGYGAQACWRGPRLFDGDATRDLLKQQVQWFKQYRTILESDIVHSSSRRADGQSLDWVLHANPVSDPPGMLVVYNPTDKPLQQLVPLNLYYTGLSDQVAAMDAEGNVHAVQLDRRGRGAISVEVPAGASRWFTIR